MSPAASTEHGQSQELHDYGMTNGHPPIADKLVMIDFDGTLVPWGPLMGAKQPTPGSLYAIRSLVRHGYRIGIFTSRMSRTWAESVVGKQWSEQNKFLDEQWDYVKAILDTHSIPFEVITAEKIPAQAYIDDKAVGYRGDWGAVLADPLLALPLDRHRAGGCHIVGGNWCQTHMAFMEDQ